MFCTADRFRNIFLTSVEKFDILSLEEIKLLSKKEVFPMLRRWIPALMLAACCLAFSGCQDSASAQNTIAPAQLSQQ